MLRHFLGRLGRLLCKNIHSLYIVRESGLRMEFNSWLKLQFSHSLLKQRPITVLYAFLSECKILDASWLCLTSSLLLDYHID